MKQETREAWLLAAASRTGKIVVKAAGPLSNLSPIYVSVGFPKGARGGRGGRAVGQCWDGTSCRDGRPHVFVCPTVSDPEEVLAILLHEQVHAAVGCAEKHRGRFAKTMKAAGMVKPWTSSVPGEELAAELKVIAGKLGPYPHAPLAPQLRTKPGSRLRLWQCECPVKVRVASDDFEATCDVCGESFKQPGGGDE